MRKKEAKKGVAMIIVLAMLVIFAALIAAVVITSTTAVRRAHFYKDRAVAVQIAQAGIQDALYWLNEKGYPDRHYPCTDLKAINPPFYTYKPDDRYFQGSDWTGEDTKIWTDEIIYFNPSDIPGGKCTVEFEDNSLPDKDTIKATGEYKGRRATVSVQLRGNNGEGNDDHNNGFRFLTDWNGSETDTATWGVPEAFNKHTLYAKEIEFPVTPSGIDITGNVTYQTITNPLDWSKATKTEAIIDISNMPHFNPNHYTLPPLHVVPPNDIYDASGLLNGVDDVNTLYDGVHWNGTEYLFGVADDGISPEPFNAGGRSILVEANVVIPDNGSSVTIDGYFRTTGSLTINQGIVTSIGPNNFCFDVAGNLNITPDITIDGDVRTKTQVTLNNTIEGKVLSDTNVTISGGTIAGDVLSFGNITVSNGNINGSVVSGGNITISGGTINATPSSYDAAVYLYNKTGVGTGEILINGSPTITIGANQRAGILVYMPEGTGNIEIGNPFTLHYVNDIKPEQFAVINSSGNASVNINAGIDLRGSIYSSENITMNNAIKRITGMLVAGGKMTIGNNSTIEYDPYLQRSTIYKGFKGGRRRYIPVPDSWKITW